MRRRDRHLIIAGVVITAVIWATVFFISAGGNPGPTSVGYGVTVPTPTVQR